MPSEVVGCVGRPDAGGGEVYTVETVPSAELTGMGARAKGV